MKAIIYYLTRPLVLTVLALASLMTSSLAQEVFIPDPGLNAAIREALEKPFGPLNEQDLLRLTVLNASRRNVSGIAGLEAARNLVSLDLQINRLSDFSLPSGLTKLVFLDVSVNPLTNFSLPTGLTNLSRLIIESTGLTNLNLPAGLTALNDLALDGNQLTSFDQLSNLTSLVSLDLGFNFFTNFSLPKGLTNLATLKIAASSLTNITLPPGLTRLTNLHLTQNQLTSFALPAGMTNLLNLNLFFNQLTNLTLPADVRNLTELNLDFNRFTSLNLPTNLTGLSILHVRANQLTDFTVPAAWTALSFLDVRQNQLSHFTLPASLNRLATLALSENRFTSFTLPAGLTNLVGLSLAGNQLTNVVLPPDLSHLRLLDLSGNQLSSMALPAGLTNLFGLFLTSNQLTTLTLPPDMTQLGALGFLGNPLATLVLSEPLAATSLAQELMFVRSQGVSVFTYPLAVRLVRPLALVGAFKFGITGPPGVYAVLGSTNLAAWSVLGSATNPLGSINFTDVTANSSAHKFYRALLQSSLPNMVFIAPNTFMMGSPTNEMDRSSTEGPQTTVILSRGFWIGKYEVTQGEYLAVMNTNPSVFPGDLSRPVSSVSWPDATNYCRKLTQRELAEGRIPAGSHYRLPTEAEWECAARAGTSTRFSYGDDPGYASLGSHAWYASNSGLTPHPVGQKRPNPWGLYDMEGNVVEWCQDWFGFLPGGVQTDPTGPASSPSGRKVTRGGAFDNTEQSSRSAARSLFNAGLFDTDTDLGFRVVLVTEPQ